MSTVEQLINLNDLSPKAQKHVSHVYSILSGGVIISVLSGYISSFGLIPAGLIYFGFMLNMIFELAIFFMGKRINQTYRMYSFYAITFLIGAAIGGGFSTLTGKALIEAKSIILSSAIITASLFSAITVFSFLTAKRAVILLGSLLVSLVLSVISIFMYNSPTKIILGLIIGCLYVVTDTQLMIQKAENGVFEPYTDARQLFYDLVKIFVEIMKLLNENNKKKKKDDN